MNFVRAGRPLSSQIGTHMTVRARESGLGSWLKLLAKREHLKTFSVVPSSLLSHRRRFETRFL